MFSKTTYMLQYYMRYGKIDTSLDRNISYILYYVMKPLKKYFFYNSSIKVYRISISCRFRSCWWINVNKQSLYDWINRFSIIPIAHTAALTPIIYEWHCVPLLLSWMVTFIFLFFICDIQGAIMIMLSGRIFRRTDTVKTMDDRLKIIKFTTPVSNLNVGH